MEKDIGSNVFFNDGSFMEKFKRLQQEKQQDSGISNATNHVTQANSCAPSESRSTFSKMPKLGTNLSESCNSKPSSLGGKLTFSLKHKSKIAAAPIKFTEDDDNEDEEATEIVSEKKLVKRPRFGLPDNSEPRSEQENAVPSVPIDPTDPTVKNVADKLAFFVAKNGRRFEHVARQRNPGDTPFKFLFDVSSADYKYYEFRLVQEERALAQDTESQARYAESVEKSSSRTSINSQRGSLHQSNYQIPASALYHTNESQQVSTTTNQEKFAEKSSLGESDPIAMMEFYVKKAAQEERKRQPKLTKDEMPPPSSLQVSSKRGHHMGDFIPQEELETFLACCGDAVTQKEASKAIQSDNVGHKLLSKMGWKEGEGLGSSRSGRAEPLMAGNVKLNNLGVGAQNPGQVTPNDDIYEQYKKRMMLGYRHRPNPLNNPRKSYY